MSNLTGPEMSSLSRSTRANGCTAQSKVNAVTCLIVVSGLLGCRAAPGSDARLGAPMTAEEGRSPSMTETKPPTTPAASLASTNGTTASGTAAQPASGAVTLALTLEDAKQIQRALLERLEQSTLADREDLLAMTRNAEPYWDSGLIHLGGWWLQSNTAAATATVKLTYRGPLYGDAAQLFASTAIREAGVWRVTPVKSGEVRRR
jgi:hypothetical protein